MQIYVAQNCKIVMFQRIPGNLIDPNTPEGTRADVKINIRNMDLKQKLRVQKSKIFIPRTLDKCKEVAIKEENPRSLQSKYEGPFDVFSRRTIIKQ